MDTVTGEHEDDVMKTPGNSGTVATKTQAHTPNQLIMVYMELQILLKTLLLERHQRFMQLMDTFESCARKTSGLHGDAEKLEPSQEWSIETASRPHYPKFWGNIRSRKQFLY